jgi:hypothetical protein
MTQSLKLTPKEWTILKMFIVQEGVALESVKHNPRRKQKGFVPRDLAPDHFYSYPDDIVALLTTQQYVDRDEKGSYFSDFHKGFVKDVQAVTIPTAGKACRKFVKLGIFEVKMDWTHKDKPHLTRTDKKFQKTTQYFLKSDFETFKRVLQFLMQNCDSYERVELLSRPYFRKILTDDLVRMRLFEKQVSIITRIDIFDWAPNEIPRVLAIFRENEEIDNVDFEEEIREEIREKDADLLFFGDNDASNWVFSYPFFGQYQIPVFPDGVPMEEKLKKINKGHPPSDTASKNFNDACTYYPDVFDNQFRTIEQEGLILPILGLIHSSPEALAEFFLGDWQPFTFDHGIVHKKDVSFNCPIFLRLISLAISDIANTQQIPGNKNVDSFEFRDFSKKMLKNGNFCQEDALLRIGLTRGYDIYYDMGYHTNFRKYSSSFFPTIHERRLRSDNLWTKIIVKQDSHFFIREGSIKDIKLLLAVLKANNQVSKHIREKISNRMQNLILHYENKTPTPAFTTFLIEEINRALLREDFYEEKAFSNIKISPGTQEAINGLFRFKEYNEGESTGSNYLVLLHRNRSLLDDAFPDAIARFGTQTMRMEGTDE